MNKFKKGQKVKIPKTKSVECRIHESGVIKKAEEIGQDYLVVKYYDRYENHYVVAVEPAEGGDYFAEHDLEAYSEFKVGDKVKVPTKKTTGLPLDEIAHLLDPHEYLYVVEVEDYGKRRVSISETEHDFLGYVFNQSDLEHYIEEPKFKKGDKVAIPKTKSIGEPIETSNMRRRAIEEGQDFMYVTGEEGLTEGYTLHYSEKGLGGDFYHEKDLELYVEPDYASNPPEPAFSPFLTVPFDPEPTNKGVDIGEKFESLDADIKHIVRELVETQERLEKLEKTPVAVSMHTKDAGSSVKHVYVHDVTSSMTESVYKASVRFNDGKRIMVEVTLSNEEMNNIFSKNETIPQHIRKMFK